MPADPPSPAKGRLASPVGLWAIPWPRSSGWLIHACYLILSLPSLHNLGHQRRANVAVVQA